MVDTSGDYSRDDKKAANQMFTDMLKMQRYGEEYTTVDPADFMGGVDGGVAEEKVAEVVDTKLTLKQKNLNILNKYMNQTNVYAPDADPLKAKKEAVDWTMGIHGLLWGASDELIGTIKGLLNPDITVQEGIAERRKNIADARDQFPGRALSAEMIGGFASGFGPYQIVKGAVKTAFPILKKIPKLIGAIGEGAVVGGIYGTAEGEGTLGKRIGGATDEAAIAAAINPAIRFAGSIAIGAKNIFLDPALRKISGRVPAPVEREILDILNTSGLSLDDFFAGVKSGKILSELGDGMSNATKEALAILQTKGGAGADLMHQTLLKRASQMRVEIQKALQADLTPNTPSGNLVIASADNFEEMAKKEGVEYKRIFNETKRLLDGSNYQTSQLFDLKSSLEDVLNRSDKDFIANTISLMKKEKVPIFWSKYRNPAYNPKLTFEQRAGMVPVEAGPKFIYRIDESKMTLENIEKFRRALANKAETYKENVLGQIKIKQGESANFNAWKSLDQEIRKPLDEISPELANVRAKWAEIARFREFQDEGERIFANSPDKAEQIWINLQKRLNTAEDIASFNTGVVTYIRSKLAGNKDQLISGLKTVEFGSLPAKERTILELIYPGMSVSPVSKTPIIAEKKVKGEGVFSNVTRTVKEDVTEKAQGPFIARNPLQELFNKVDLFVNQKAALNIIVGGSPSGKRVVGANQKGLFGMGITDAITTAVDPTGIGAISAIARTVANNFGGISKSNSLKIAEIAVETNPEILKMKLTDPAYMDILKKVATRVMKGSQTGQLASATIATDEYSEGIANMVGLKALAEGTSSSSAKKIIAASNAQ